MLRNIGQRRPTALWPRLSQQLRSRSFQSKLSTNHNGRNIILLATLGLGTVSAAGYLWFPESYTVHVDADLRHRESSNRFTRAVESWRAPSFQLPGAQRIDAFDLTSNFPGEDSIGVCFLPLSDTLGYLWVGIFDGHNGSATSIHLVHYLSDAVMGYLSDIYSMHAANKSIVDVTTGLVVDSRPGSPPDPVPPDEEIDEGIQEAFKAVDNMIVQEMAQEALGLDDASFRALQSDNSSPQPNGIPVSKAVERLSCAESGSCALVGLYNTGDRSLRVALAGDSRAVLGRRIPTTTGYKYEARVLTVDQNAGNPAEAARLTAEHPNEPDLLKGGRVLGWGPARAFGDGAMKWSRAVQERLHANFLGSRPRKECKTPPYFTAEPVITTEKDVRRGDFAVFASDGIWDSLTSEEVVGLVGQWLEERGSTERVLGNDGRAYEIRIPYIQQTGPSPAQNLPPHKENIYTPGDLPVIYPQDYKDSTVMYKYWRRPKRFVVEDDNIAAHLTRNALAGADSDFREALLSMEPKRARRFR